jgi:hypothetical protein
MSKGIWRRMDRKSWRRKNAYDDAMIFDDDLVKAPVKAGHHGRRGGDHQPWRQGEAPALDQRYGAL